MALNVILPKNMSAAIIPPLKSPVRAFVDFLIKQGALKEDFRSIIANKDFSEVDEFLLSRRLIEPERLSRLYADFYKLPFIRLVDRPIQPSVLQLLPREVAKRYWVMPYELNGLKLHLAVGDPARLQANAPSIIAGLKRDRGLSIELAVAPRAEVEAVLHKLDAPILSSYKPVLESAVFHQPPPPLNPERTETAHKSPVNPVKSLNKADLLKEVEPREKVIDLKTVKITPEVLNKIPISVAKRYSIITFDQLPPKSPFEPAMIKIAMVRPDDASAKEIVNYIENKNKVLVDRYRTTPESFNHALALYQEHLNSEGQIKSEVVDKSPIKEQVSVSTKVSATETTKRSASESPENQNEAESQLPDSKETTKVSGVNEGMILSSEDIVSRPNVGESTEELQRLAKEQENSLESQNLDRLLRAPVNSVDDLAKVFRTGVIPEIVAATLFLAIKMKASDVHLEALVNAVRVRFRIDGILHDVLSVPHFLHAPLISRIKILAKMKIDEQRIPQDGRFDVIIASRQVDLRVSTLPTVHGEKIVMRLLDKSGGVLTLEQLGVTGSNFDILVENINRPYGVILATGPTGSGKSTTLYAVLNRLSKPGVNIITLEDPVEYELPGVNQAQVKPQIGFTFAEGLRSVLRQDPNIIMVGEVRDLETAAMATHAALTGHLVLTTLHTNDAAGALPRLINMGVEPFLITSSLNAVVGQRLVRKICDKCREKAEIPHSLLETIKSELASLPSGQMKNINPEQLVFYHGRGCSECNNGYSGRIGIYEVLAMSNQVEELAVKKAPTSEIKKAAIANGMITMTQDGLLKALKGITTIDEVMRVTTAHTKEVPGVE